jgi:hypothetical protein
MQLEDQLVKDQSGDEAVLVEVDGERQLDLAAVAGSSEVGRPQDEAGRPLPQQCCDLGVQQPARHGHREHVPAQVPLLSRAAPIDEDRHLRLTETILLLEHRGDRRDRVALADDARQAQESREAIPGEKVGFEGEGCCEARDRGTRTVGR